MATQKAKVEALVNKVQNLGEADEIEEAFAMLPKQLTPARKVRLTAGYKPHVKRMSADDIAFEEAWEDWNIALELGELE